MKYVIGIFDSVTEELTQEIELPAFRHSELAELMNWKAPEDAINVYDLSDAQLNTIQEWLGQEIRSPHHIIQLAAFV